MRILLISTLGLVLLLLSFQIHSQSLDIKDLQQSATRQLAPGLEIQEKCAKQAAVEFRQEGLESLGTAEFTNHYNPRLGRCFVVTSSTSAGNNVIAIRKLLVDAYEGRVYGSYQWTSSDERKYLETPPSDCAVTLPSGGEKKCHSAEEWKTLTNSYMEAQ